MSWKHKKYEKKDSYDVYEKSKQAAAQE